ncbi:MAG: tetratricopeptide repeat protein [Ignavibacteriales bacterium]|nr:tetratricopeptide repeat protein [Ignavibacteriales bacterium]
MLGRIERFLGLPSPCSNDTQEREALVRNALTSKRTLLGLDNFETLNYALNEKGSDEEKTAKSLHTFFKSLAANGVTLCVTSREVTNLPGETVEDIQGLTNESGGRLFQENVVRQKGEIYIEETQQVSEIVGGHPLALRLLASAFDDQVGTSLDQYIVSLQSFLPKARDKWTEEDRHESLRASFDFTMNNLIKTGAGKELQIALIRLSVFVAFFAPIVAAYTITNKWSETNDVEEQDENAEKISHALWERGLLERTTLTFEDGNIYLYRLHPVLGFFVKEQWTDAEIVKENYWKSMSTLANVAEKQITKSPFWAQVALRAIPDLILASESKIDAEAAHIQYQIAQLLQQFGRYDDSLQLLEKSRNTLGLFNQQRERAATIHATANIHLARGNLDEAMKLYQQLQEIYKGLGELLGEAIIINEMGKIYEIRGKLDVALGMYEQSLTIAQQLGDGTQTSAALHNIANIHTTRGNWDNAMKLYQQSLKIGNDLGELKHEATTLHSMANIHTMRGDWDDAMELYQQALRIQESLNDLQGKSITLTNMAQIYIRRGNLDEAMELYQLALRVQESLGDLRGKSATLHHMGLIFARRDDLDGAMKLYQQSLEINEGLGDLQGRSATLSQMSNIYWEKENYNEAKRLMEQSLQLFNQIGDIEGGAKAIAKLGQLCRARGDKKSALAYYQEALALLENLGAQPLVAEVRQLIASLESDTRVGKQQQGMTTEQFIAGAIQSAREKRPEAEDYFKSAQKMAADSNVPAEMRELGRVLQRIILGEKNVDLSSLPREWAEMVRKTVHE